MHRRILGVILSIILIFSSTAAAGDYVTDSLSPLHQVKHGIPSENVVCKHGLQLINKKEDGSPACVTQATFVRLLSVHWGSDPSKEWTFDGLNDTYKSGEQIIFGVKFQGYHNPCSWPPVDIKHDNKTVWNSKIVALGGCPFLPKSELHYFEVEWKTGTKPNDIGNLILNQTGKYSVVIELPWLEKNVQKNITVVP